MNRLSIIVLLIFCVLVNTFKFPDLKIGQKISDFTKELIHFGINKEPSTKSNLSDLISKLAVNPKFEFLNEAHNLDKLGIDSDNYGVLEDAYLTTVRYINFFFFNWSQYFLHFYSHN